MRVLLICPKTPEAFWSFRWATRTILPRKRAPNPPLGLATVAALCPPHWKVTIVDENVEALPLAPEADIIGVTGMGVQFARQRELLRYYRRNGYYVVAGGSYASLCPEQYTDLTDTMVCGEAEYIWPRFCADFEAGRPQPLYRESGTVALGDSPAPRFDLLRQELYTTAAMQFSRGCPYMCEFCDIIVMFGRRPRHKSVEQVGGELDSLRERGVHRVFFVDDNLIGNRKVAKELLRFLCSYQRLHGYQFRFGSQVSLNLAQDPELMRLLREANFNWVFIGIESPDEDSLRETRKVQNMAESPLESVHRIHSYGLDIMGGFIVGFDHDSTETFERQYRFIMRSGIQSAMVSLLVALPRTPLYERLRTAGRLREGAGEGDNYKLETNVTPVGMSYGQLVTGYKRLVERLLTNGAIAQRVINKHRFLRRPPPPGEYSPGESLRILARLFWHGLIPGGVGRLYHFARSLPWRAPRSMPDAVADWIMGLSMRDFVDRRFGGAGAEASVSWQSRVARLRSALSPYTGEAKLVVSERAESAGGPLLTLSLNSVHSKQLLARAARHLHALLRHTPSRLLIRIEDIRLADLPRLRRLLRRLARSGDRISIEIGARVQGLLAGDAWAFRQVLPATAYNGALDRDRCAPRE